MLSMLERLHVSVKADGLGVGVTMYEEEHGTARPDPNV